MPVTPQTTTTTTTTAVEDYLEQIHHLIQAKGYARAIEIADPDSRPLQILNDGNRTLQALRSSADRSDCRTVRVVRAMREV